MKNKIRVLIVSLMAMGGMGAAQADSLSVSGSTSVPTMTQAFGPTEDSAYVSNGAYSYDNAGNTASAWAWGNDHGTYRASAYGDGTFSASSNFHRTLELVNSLGGDAQFSLNFFIYYGGIYINNDAGVAGSGSVGYDLKLTSGATSLYASSAILDSTGNVTAVNALSNASLYNGGNYLSYSWDGTYVTLDLGVLGAGETKTIDFDLVSTAMGTFALESYTCGEWGYGEPVAALAVADGGYGGDIGGGGTCYRTASVGGGLGDPADASGTLPPGGANFQLNATLVNPVPAPASLSLVGIGLAALAGVRRRRR